MNRQELARELEELQDRYKLQQKYGRSVQPESAVPKGPAALRAAEERMAARLPASRAERAMAEITEGQALWQRFEAQAEADEKSRELHGPSGIAQRKDGLDMSFQQLLGDASRMRAQLSEIGLQLGRSGREKAVQHLKQNAVPRDLQEEFQEQQKVLLEQRRLLEQLRHEKLAAEGDQYWLHRKNRLDHEDLVVGKPVDCAVPPEELRQAHERLRLEPEEERMYGWSDPQGAVAPQDAYVRAEIMQVARRQAGAVAELCVVDKAGVTLARSSCDFPDAVNKRCVMSVSVPEALGNAVVEVWLLGPEQQNYLQIALSELPQVAEAKDYAMNGEKPLTARMQLCCVRPSHGRLETSRVVENPSVCPSSFLPSGYAPLPPSDAHRRAMKASWQRQGRPDHLHGVEAERLGSEEARRSRAAALRKRALPEVEAEPEPREPAPGGFFSGWEEPQDPSEEPQPRPSSSWSWTAEEPAEPAEEDRSLTPRGRNYGFAERGVEVAHGREEVSTPGFGAHSRARPYVAESGWQFPFAAFAGFGTKVEEERRSAHVPQEQVPEAPEDSGGFLASLSMPFAAFAGFGASETAPKAPPPKAKPPEKAVEKVTLGWQPWATYAAAAEEEPVKHPERAVLPLRPPHSSRSLEQLYGKLLGRQKDGRLGHRSVAQDVLELAARVAQPTALAEQAEEQITAYAALLLDSLQQYEESDVLGLWIVEALTSLFRCSSALQQAEFSLPFFRAFVAVALRFRGHQNLNLHMRILQGLAEVASPDCRLCDPGLLAYVMDQLDQHRNKLNTLTMEHALAILCMLRTPVRVSEQIRHCLLVLRGLKSEQHLCTRALVTAAELYQVVDQLMEKERQTWEEASYLASRFDDAARSAFASELNLPESGMDVRLVATVMDLYPQNRKLAGAALRSFAAMARVTGQHLEDILKDEVRPISNALQQHGRSRSVNLHVAELVHLVATRRPELASDALIMMACKSLRNSTRDAEIVAQLLAALQIFLEALPSGAQELHLSLAQALPSDVLVKVGETHFANSQVVAPLCCCMDLQASVALDYRDDFVDAGAVAIPLRVFDQAQVHSAEACAKAAALLKELLIESRKAAGHFIDAGGPRLILNLLSQQSESPAVVTNAFAALAVAAQFVPVRRALVHPELPHTLTIFNQLFRLAEAHVEKEPDVLCWACLAAGALSECEHEESQEIMRKAMDMELLAACLSKMPIFEITMAFCQELIATAASSSLTARRIRGAPPPRRAAPEPGRSFHAEAVAVKPAPRRAQGTWHEPLDVFGPLRGLGVGREQGPGSITQEQLQVLQGVESAPVKGEVARKFMRAMQEEFLKGQAGAVQSFMTRRGEPVTDEQGELWEGDYVLTADEQRTLRPFIQRMQDAEDKLREYEEIQHRWNVRAEEDEAESGFFGLFDTESKASEAAEAKAAPTRAQMMEDSD